MAGHIKRRILSTPGFPGPVQKTAAAKVNHRAGPLPCGGLGVFATCLVCTGDLIVAERALPILPHAFKKTAVPGSKGLTEEHKDEEYLGIAVERRTDKIREAFMALGEQSY